MTLTPSRWYLTTHGLGKSLTVTNLPGYNLLAKTYIVSILSNDILDLEHGITLIDKSFQIGVTPQDNRKITASYRSVLPHK